MKEITIFRHEDGTARWIVWKDRDNPSIEEINPEWAVFITYTIMPGEFCNYVANATKEKVHELLDSFIIKK